MLALVDDKRHYVNSLPTQSNKDILTAMKLFVSSWNEFLHFVGGSLETSKCAWYFINWEFDSHDPPIIKSTE